MHKHEPNSSKVGAVLHPNVVELILLRVRDTLFYITNKTQLLSSYLSKPCTVMWTLELRLIKRHALSFEEYGKSTTVVTSNLFIAYFLSDSSNVPNVDEPILMH